MSISFHKSVQHGEAAAYFGIQSAHQDPAGDDGRSTAIIDPFKTKITGLASRR
jgi:hypothetical protein